MAVENNTCSNCRFYTKESTCGNYLLKHYGEARETYDTCFMFSAKFSKVKKITDKTITAIKMPVNPALTDWLRIRSYHINDFDFAFRDSAISLCRYYDSSLYLLLINETVHKINQGSFNSLLERIRNMNHDEAVDHIRASFQNGRLRFEKG